MTRIKNDNYPTESAMLAPLLALQEGQMIKGTVLEPCAGAGQLASPLRAAGLKVITNDIDPKYKTNYNLDAAIRKSWLEFPRFDWTISNPPYSYLEEFLEMSLACSEVGVAMLVRLTALEPVIRRSKRGEILEQYKDNLRYVMPFSAPRPKFIEGKGTDSVTTCWLVFNHGWSWKAQGMESPLQFVTEWRI